MVFALSLAASEHPVVPPEPVPPVTDPDTVLAAATDAVTLEELRRFVLVFREVQRAHVEPVSERELMEAAIRGLLSGLDPHSDYLDQDELQALNEDASGEYGGLGLELQVREGALRVVAAIDDTPAAKAGLQTGDLILRIDGTPLEGAALLGAVDRLRGAPGSRLQLTVQRGGETPFVVELQREVIKVSSVRTRWLAPDLAWLRISSFQYDTGADVAKAIRGLRERRAVAGLVLDLRSNPGGLLQAAVETADGFLEQGRIVSTRGRLPVASMSFDAKPGDLLQGAPLVVLIDGGSASAAEIVAGALQDHRRAVVVGQPSFGKGSVQSILPLANGDGVKLTTARYYTPQDRSIQAEGIVPDVELPDVHFERVAPVAATRRTREADLAGRLDSASPHAAVAASDQESQGAGNDYALNEALHILRALVRAGTYSYDPAQPPALDQAAPAGAAHP